MVYYVPTGISGLEDFFNIFRTLLNFPSYFGFNWNAFDECITDLDWITYYEVWIVFSDTPNISERDLKILNNIMIDAVDHWSRTKEKNLSVVAPHGFLGAGITTK
ncbi:hypothetical protein AA0323_1433 [Asaia siamensis NRIC 0323]|nr:hypothetical protein AA0323_1433 [Asaia siamensis NRIC 0323]